MHEISCLQNGQHLHWEVKLPSFLCNSESEMWCDCQYRRRPVLTRVLVAMRRGTCWWLVQPGSSAITSRPLSPHLFTTSSESTTSTTITTSDSNTWVLSYRRISWLSSSRLMACLHNCPVTYWITAEARQSPELRRLELGYTSSFWKPYSLKSPFILGGNKYGRRPIQRLNCTLLRLHDTVGFLTATFVSWRWNDRVGWNGEWLRAIVWYPLCHWWPLLNCLMSLRGVACYGQVEENNSFWNVDLSRDSSSSPRLKLGTHYPCDTSSVYRALMESVAKYWIPT